MTVTIDLQLASEAAGLPTAEQLQAWVETALSSRHDDAELCIRIVDAPESQQLNRDYRGKDKPTNVLSFPFEAPVGIELQWLDNCPLGDLVICAPVVMTEADQQDKPLLHHWAHMVVHGVLHLLGYDHISDEQAQEMEPLEVQILAKLGIDDPYHDDA